MIVWFLLGFILGYFTIMLDFKDKQTIGFVLLEEKELP